MKKHIRNVLTLLALLVAIALPEAKAQSALRIPPEQQKGFASYVRSSPTYIDAVVLVATVNQTYTVPANADAVILSANCPEFYAIVGPTAAVPAANVTNGTGSEMNPSSWYIGRATQIGLISPTACKVTLSWYRLVIP